MNAIRMGITVAPRTVDNVGRIFGPEAYMRAMNAMDSDRKVHRMGDKVHFLSSGIH